MGYLESSLSEGEIARCVAHRRWISYLTRTLVLALGIWLFSVGVSMPKDEGAFPGSIGLVLALLGLLGLPIACLQNRSKELAITNQKVMGKWGVIVRRTIEQNLEKVDSVQVNQGIFGRILNYGTIYVHGSGLSTTPIKQIADPLEFRRQLANATTAIRKA
jgi:uncharacterized membrane protein YdbT with pleckstrin-like domain